MLFLKKHWSLILALAIPCILILFILASIYFSNWLFKPRYNFLYTSGEYRYQAPHYEVNRGRLTLNCGTIHHSYIEKLGERDQVLPVIPSECEPEQAGTLYIYDVRTNTSRSIPFEQAEQLTLAGRRSPDGYEVSRGSSGGGDFLFFSGGSNYDTWYLKKGETLGKKIELQEVSSDGYSEGEAYFLGWIVE